MMFFVKISDSALLQKLLFLTYHRLFSRLKRLQDGPDQVLFFFGGSEFIRETTNPQAKLVMADSTIIRG